MIATTRTDRRGNHSFTSLPETGDYTVQVLPPGGNAATTALARPVSIRRGDTAVSGQDFGVRPIATPRPPRMAAADALFTEFGRVLLSLPGQRRRYQRPRGICRSGTASLPSDTVERVAVVFRPVIEADVQPRDAGPGGAQPHGVVAEPTLHRRADLLQEVALRLRGVPDERRQMAVGGVRLGGRGTIRMASRPMLGNSITA